MALVGVSLFRHDLAQQVGEKAEAEHEDRREHANAREQRSGRRPRHQCEDDGEYRDNHASCGQQEEHLQHVFAQATARQEKHALLALAE